MRRLVSSVVGVALVAVSLRTATPKSAMCCRVSRPLAVLWVVLLAAVLTVTVGEVWTAPSRPVAAQETEAVSAEQLPPLPSAERPRVLPSVPQGRFDQGRGWQDRPEPASTPDRRLERSPYDPARSRLVERRRFADVYENPDGTRTARIGQQQRNVLGADGQWQPISTELEQVPDGSWRTGPHPLAPRLAAESNAERLLSVSTPAGALSLGLQGAAGRSGARTGKSGLRYRGVARDLDLDYVVTPEAVKETLILANPTAVREQG